MAKSINSPGNTGHPLRALVAQYSLMGDDNPSKSILAALLRNVRQIPSLTVKDAAYLCGASRSTFLRFCHEVGFTSYTALRNSIEEDLRRELEPRPAAQEDALSAVVLGAIRAAAKLEQELDRDACRQTTALLRQAQTVRFHDRLFSTIRLNLQTHLLLDGKNATLSRGEEEQEADLKQAGRGTLLFLANGDRMQLQTLEAIRARGAKIVVLTDRAHFPAEAACDCVIRYGTPPSETAYILVTDLIYQYLDQLYLQRV